MYIYEISRIKRNKYCTSKLCETLFNFYIMLHFINKLCIHYKYINYLTNYCILIKNQAYCTYKNRKYDHETRSFINVCSFVCR